MGYAIPRRRAAPVRGGGGVVMSTTKLLRGYQTARSNAWEPIESGIRLATSHEPQSPPQPSHRPARGFPADRVHVAARRRLNAEPRLVPEREPRRFGKLRNDLPTILAKVLTSRLRDLEAKRMVSRTVLPTSIRQ